MRCEFVPVPPSCVVLRLLGVMVVSPRLCLLTYPCIHRFWSHVDFSKRPFCLVCLFVSCVLCPYHLCFVQAASAPGAPGPRRPRFSYGGGQALGGVDPQSGLDRWKLVKPEEEVRDRG